jgi:hypothetical protein
MEALWFEPADVPLPQGAKVLELALPGLHFRSRGPSSLAKSGETTHDFRHVDCHDCAA